MNNTILHLPEPYNEPIKSYLPGSQEREAIDAELKRQKSMVVDIPLIINGQKIKSDTIVNVTCPHDHSHRLATVSLASQKQVKMAIESALDAKQEWESMPWNHRAAIFLKAADLISQKYTHQLNAATMLGQSKNVFQAEIDAVCELVDFLRFNATFMEQIYKNQPASEKGIMNRMEYRALEGFVFAITPFNFTAIAGNLCAAPALMGNTIVWKPATTAVLSNFYFMQILMEAGLPDGVINFIPASGAMTADLVLEHKALAGVHFTGSTAVFNSLWKKIGQQIDSYHAYPRIVGETGGKDYIFMHPSANVDQVVTAAIRGAFEFQGQKCSACSRMYVPQSKWDELRKKIVEQTDSISMGDVTDHKNFVNAVIDQDAFDRVSGFIERAKTSGAAQIIAGGKVDKTRGYFIDPTIILAREPDYETMTQELFGPVLTIYVYKDSKLDQTLVLLNETSRYALTGAVFASDRKAIVKMESVLSNSAGNFYINDKPTGAVVGQQPFGGARASGTNDKAGSYLNLLRWTSARTIKENFVPPEAYPYPFMG